MSLGITTPELLKMIDEAGLELQTKPGHLTAPAIQALVEKLNGRNPSGLDSEE